MRRLLKPAALMLLLAVLAGCATARGFSEAGADKIRQAADINARIWIQTPCLITYGGAQRVLTDRERELLELVAETSCALPDAPPLTEAERDALPPQ